MNLYIICRKECNHYLAAGNWSYDNGFHWTTDIFFSVFGSDEAMLTLYYAKKLMDYPAYMIDFHVREMTEPENIALSKLQTYHYKWSTTLMSKIQ